MPYSQKHILHVISIYNQHVYNGKCEKNYGRQSNQVIIQQISKRKTLSNSLYAMKLAECRVGKVTRIVFLQNIRTMTSNK